MVTEGGQEQSARLVQSAERWASTARAEDRRPLQPLGPVAVPTGPRRRRSRPLMRSAGCAQEAQRRVHPPQYLQEQQPAVRASLRAPSKVLQRCRRRPLTARPTARQRASCHACQHHRPSPLLHQARLKRHLERPQPRRVQQLAPQRSFHLEQAPHLAREAHAASACEPATWCLRYRQSASSPPCRPQYRVAERRALSSAAC